MEAVRQERTGWRDQEYSAWHRERLGYNCPLLDVDTLWVEYDRGAPVALIETKAYPATVEDPNHPSYQAIRALADGCRIPFFAVRYRRNPWRFEVSALNAFARQKLSTTKVMSEKDYVRFHYWLRGRDTTHEAAKALLPFVPRMAMVCSS